MRVLRYHQPGITHFLTQQEKTIAGCFYDDACSQYYICRLLNSLKTFKVCLHAYCVLPNRVLLLVTPGTPTGINRLLDTVMCQYREYYGDRFTRASDCLGKNRKSKPLTTEGEVLQSQIAIEQQPLIEGLVNHAAMYRWSSYSSNGFGIRSSFLTNHPEFDFFLRNTINPHQKYHSLISSQLPFPLTPWHPTAAEEAVAMTDNLEN